MLSPHIIQCIFFLGSAAAKAAEEGLQDNSDNDSEEEEEFIASEQEDEDSDLDGDEESDEEEIMPKTPASSKKKATPKKATAEGDLSSRMSRMQVSASKEFSMSFKCPYILSQYNEGVDQMVKVELFVPTLPQSFFLPDVVDAGKQLEVRVQVPNFFADEDRVIESNNHVAGFNQNTHEAQAFKDVCERIDTHYGMSNEIFGDEPQLIVLPFVCEERVVEWEVQAYPNDDDDLTNNLGGQQFYLVMRVVLRKLKTKRRTAGGFRVVGGNAAPMQQQANP